MADGMIAALTAINPGIFMILAGVLTWFAPGAALRSAALVSGPVLALLALMAGDWGRDAGRVGFVGLDLAPYSVDSLSFVFGLVFIIASFLCGVYSLHRHDRLQDASGLVYAGSALSAVFAGDLVSFFVCLELSALASVFLVMGRRSPEGIAAGSRYLGMQILAGLLFLGGLLQRMAEGLPIRFDDMGEGVAIAGLIPVGEAGGVLMLAGLGVKAAFPLAHTWLQDAYPRATDSGAVILSAFTTKLAVYALARLFAGEDTLIVIGAVMTVFPVFFAVIENDLRKVLAYSLNNQVGFMVCAVGVGTELAINGAAAHAFAHVIYKALLFMSMGAVLLRVGSTKATELGGLHRTMPLTALFCMIGAASISALPLFSGFVAKSLTMSAVQGEGLLWIWLALLFASAGVLEHSGIKIPFFAFFGHDSGKRPREAPFNMLLAMGLAAFLSVSIGVFPGWLYEILPYPDAALEYLAHDLWTAAHVLTQLQLAVFAAIAFVLLYQSGLYPTERPGLILDADWIWRSWGPRQARRAGAALKWKGSVGAGGAAIAARCVSACCEVSARASALIGRGGAATGVLLLMIMIFVWGIVLLFPF